MTDSETSGITPTPLPLQLCSVTIQNFRSLHCVGPVPIQPDLTVLTGENDGGKSAFIDAIAFLLGQGSVDDDDHSRWQSDDPQVLVEGELCELDNAAGRQRVRIRARREMGGRRIIEIMDRIHTALGARPQDMKVDDLRANIANLSIPTSGGRDKASLVDAVNTWLRQRPAEEFKEEWRALTTDEAKRLPRFTRFNSADAPSPVSTLRSVIGRSALQLIAQGDYPGQLAQVGAKLNSDIKASISRIKNKIMQYCPDIDSIDIDASFDFTRPSIDVYLHMTRQGMNFDVEKGGEGRRRRITLAIHEANLSFMEEEELTSSEVLAYDEPDTHLDYASQRALFDILNRQARLPQAQVLIATHSLNFIDRVPLLSILHFRLDKDLKTNVQTLLNPTHEEEQRFLASVCSGLGLRNSVLLDERCFLIVEGETEESALPKLFHHATEESLTTAGITLFSTRGCGAARRLVEVLATQWGRQVVLLVDKDTHGDHAGGISDAWLSSVNLKYGDGAYFIGTAEFEDAFSDEVWARALQAYFPPRDGGSNWSPADIAGIRRSGKKFSAELCAAVGRRCKASVGKPDLGLALAETCKAIQDMPAVLLSCFDFAMKKARH